MKNNFVIEISNKKKINELGNKWNKDCQNNARIKKECLKAPFGDTLEANSE